MMYLMMIKIVLFLLQRSFGAFADIHIIQERLVNMSSIIEKTPFATITVCSMKCSANLKCLAIGFVAYPAVQKNSECYLLDKVENYGIEEKDDFVSLFVLVKNKEIFVRRKPNLPPCPVDGGYSDWSAYTTCSKTCDDGKQSRSRTCNNPFPRGTGANCSKLGSPTEEKTCNVKPCQIHGGFSEWSSWSSCSTTCRSGTVTRTRLCDSPTPKHGGNDCTGAKTESKSCTHLKKCVTDFCKSATSGSTTTLELYDSNGNVEGSGTVLCLFTEGYQYTLFSHNALSKRRFDTSNYNNKQTIVWDSGLSFVKKAVQRFQYCIQYFHFKAQHNSPGYSCLYSHENRALCMNNAKCHGCSVIDNTATIKQGRASVNDKSFLPFTGLKFDDNNSWNEFMEIYLERLKCR